MKKPRTKKTKGIVIKETKSFAKSLGSILENKETVDSALKETVSTMRHHFKHHGWDLRIDYNVEDVLAKLYPNYREVREYVIFALATKTKTEIASTEKHCGLVYSKPKKGK
jgi:hypothetical protein